MKASWALQSIGTSRPVFDRCTVVVCNVANVPVPASASGPVAFVPSHGKSHSQISSKGASIPPAATAVPAFSATNITAAPPQLHHPLSRDLSMFRPMAKVEYIEPQALADILKSPAKESVRVIDVRDSVSLFGQNQKGCKTVAHLCPAWRSNGLYVAFSQGLSTC